MIKVFFDLEATGTDWRKHSIHQIAGCVEVDEVVAEWFNIKTRPHPKALIEPEALNVCHVTLEQVLGYQPMGDAYKQLINVLSKYINKFDNKDKAYLVGFNNRGFDDFFLRKWFEHNGDQFIGSWFWNNTLDVLVLATEYLGKRRIEMPSFKLKRVAKTVGIEVDEERLHDALYDIELTRSVYRIVTGRDFEI